MREQTFMRLYEARWHGFARWSIERLVFESDVVKVAISEVLSSGWWRPPRGWSYQEFELSTPQIPRA